jgi:hypothetical protein
MNCIKCDSTNGIYDEIEDFYPGSDPEWIYYMSYHCFDCDYVIYSYEEGFEYE